MDSDDGSLDSMASEYDPSVPESLHEAHERMHEELQGKFGYPDFDPSFAKEDFGTSTKRTLESSDSEIEEIPPPLPKRRPAAKKAKSEDPTFKRFMARFGDKNIVSFTKTSIHSYRPF